MTDKVSFDEFAGFGPHFDDDNKELGDNLVAEAMNIISNKKLHNPELRKRKKVKVVSRTYDLSDPKSRKQYEDDCAMILNGEPGSRLIVEHPPKQFVQTGDTYKYVAYMEWIEYLSEKREKNDRPAKKRGDNK